MTPDQPPQAVPVLQWNIAIAQQNADGAKVCVLQLAQSQLMMTLQLLPRDMKRLAAELAAAATQAESGLIIPTGVQFNGHTDQKKT